MCVLSALRDLWHEGSGRGADTALHNYIIHIMAFYLVYCDIIVTKQQHFVAMVAVCIQCSSDFIGCC